MPTNRIQVRAGTPVYVRLVKADDAGYVQVNNGHFDLELDETTDVTSAMQNGINRIKFVIRNKGGSMPIGGNLPGGPWAGRFELLINGRLAGSYADEGHDGLGGSEHVVATVEIIAV